MNRDTVCCVIVTYNIGDKFYNCFNSVINQVDYVIIVDNGSDSETLKVLNNIEGQYGDNVKLILNKDNKGIAVALNQGVKKGKALGYNWILTMDNDSRASKDMVSSMLSTYEACKDEKIVSIFPRYLEVGFGEDSVLLASNIKSTEYEYIEAEMTSGNLLKADIFDKVGYFEEDYFIDYVDHEYCLRIISKGFKHIRANGALLYHSLGKSTKKRFFKLSFSYTNHNVLRRYYITRNRMSVWSKYSELDNSFIKHDKSAFKKELIKILIFEDDKIKKFKAVFKGIKDFKKNN